MRISRSESRRESSFDRAGETNPPTPFTASPHLWSTLRRGTDVPARATARCMPVLCHEHAQWTPSQGTREERHFGEIVDDMVRGICVSKPEAHETGEVAWIARRTTARYAFPEG